MPGQGPARQWAGRELRGKRVTVITSKNEGQQTRWLDQVDCAFPNGGYVGVCRGDFLVAHNGPRAAASAGAAAVNGAVVPVDSSE